MTMAPPTSNSRRVPLEKRKRTETSCDKCKSRKQKCRKEPGQDACRYCAVHNIECLTTQPRKKRLYGSVEGLGHRMALLESLVKGLLPEADVSNMDEMRRLGSSLGIVLPDAVQGEQGVEQSGSSGNDTEEPLSMLPDQQGQAQYIGPASSFSFHLKLRELVGQSGVREFVLFGRNAADQEPIEGETDHRALSTPGATSNPEHSSPANQPTPSPSETPSLESLMTSYFEHINPDFPVLHEASFREAYEHWVVKPDQTDPAWLLGFLCALLLARRVGRASFPEDQERSWWRRVQALLPVVIFTSSVAAVQGLMLAALHLHNTNHRDACWNLTGTAIRIAVGIGLHQDRVNTMQTPLLRELRKRLWWTLYAFEQMQVSSYDRPSAIEHPAGMKIGCPNERIIGMAGHCPPDYSRWLNRLVVLLGSACRAPKSISNHTSSMIEESYVGPLSPAAGVLRDLDRWKESLPLHLREEAVDTAPVSFQRPLLLLHAKFHYTVLVLCRSALLTRATTIAKEGKVSPNGALTSMAASCAESGQALAQIVLKLDAMNKFDPITWWDIWYALSAASILVPDLVCRRPGEGAEEGDDPSSPPESRKLLEQLAELTTKHRRNPHMPGTLDKWASLVPELHTMASSIKYQMPKSHPTLHPDPSDRSDVKVRGMSAQGHPHSLNAQNFQPNPHYTNYQPPPVPPTFTNISKDKDTGTYLFASDNAAARLLLDSDFPPGSGFPNTRYERGAQMNFMDFTNLGDWNFTDLGSLLGGPGDAVGGQAPA